MTFKTDILNLAPKWAPRYSKLTVAPLCRYCISNCGKVRFISEIGEPDITEIEPTKMFYGARKCIQDVGLR